MWKYVSCAAPAHCPGYSKSIISPYLHINISYIDVKVCEAEQPLPRISRLLLGGHAVCTCPPLLNNLKSITYINTL